MGKLPDMGTTKSLIFRKQTQFMLVIPVFAVTYRAFVACSNFPIAFAFASYLFSSNYEFTKALTIKHLCPELLML
jgi:hypothetical protein